MQATRGNVGGNQNIQIATGKFIKNTQTFFLRDIACQQTDTMTICRQVAPDLFTTVFGVGENNRSVWPLFFDQRLQQTHFFFVRRVEKLFFNTVARFLFRFHFNIFGIVHLLERQFTYPVRKRGGEQHVEALVCRRHTAEQPADIFNKAQIVHAIGFVQHHHLNGSEVNVVLLGVVN